MSHNIVNPPPPSSYRYEHTYLPNNIGVESYLPVYSRRVRSPYQPIPLPGQRDRIIDAIDYNQVARDAEEFRRRGYVPLPELPPDWVDFIAQHLYGKSNNFVRAFMKRYIIADTLITRDHETRLRRYVLDILRRVPTRESPEEARQFLRDMWETHISLDASDPDTYELLVLFIDTEALHRMFENGVEYNQSGRVRTSPRRASSARGIGVRSSRRVRRRVSPGSSNSPPIYDGGGRRGGRRGRTHKYRTTRKSKHGGRDGYRLRDYEPHHQQLLLPEVWMRECTNGNWEELSNVKNVQNDVAEIENEINGVRGGFITPSSNPHSKRLPSGRYLRFNWKGDPSVHANIITNIKYIGKHLTCKLEKRRPKKGNFTDEFTNHR